MTATEALRPPRAAIDLGTANTRLATPEGGLLVDRPSRIERRAGTSGALALDAARLWPLARGVIVDAEGASRLLAPLIRLARGGAPAKPWILICHPSDATEGERAALIESAERAGAGVVRLLPEPLAAGFGIEPDAGHEPSGVILDLGEGVADAALLRAGRLTDSRALRLGCADLRERIRETILAEQGTRLEDEEVHRLLRTLEPDSAWIPVEHGSGSGHPRARRRHVVWAGVLVRSAAVLRAVEAYVAQLAVPVAELLRSAGSAAATPSAPLWLTGGGALFPPLVRGLGQRLGIEVRTPADPLHAVISGALRLLPSLDGDGLAAWAPARP